MMKHYVYFRKKWKICIFPWLEMRTSRCQFFYQREQIFRKLKRALYSYPKGMTLVAWLSPFSILLLRRVCCEGQREAGELCRGQVDPRTSLSHPTGDRFLWWWQYHYGCDRQEWCCCGDWCLTFCMLRTSTATVTGWSWGTPLLTALSSDQTNLLRTWQVGSYCILSTKLLLSKMVKAYAWVRNHSRYTVSLPVTCDLRNTYPAMTCQALCNKKNIHTKPNMKKGTLFLNTFWLTTNAYSLLTTQLVFDFVFVKLN